MTCQNLGEDLKNNKTYTYDEAVELTGHGKYNQLLLIACSIITCAVALDLFGFSIVVAIAKCDLNLRLTEMGVLASAPFIGVILFAYPWGFYADTRGRRKAVLLSTSVGFLFAAISSFASSWQLMMFFKVVACTFSNASYTLTMTIIGECTGSAHRGKYLFIMNSVNLVAECVSFSLAYFLLPLDFRISIPFLGIDYRPWRLFTLALALPLGIGSLMMLYLHESPKFLASRGNNKKSLEVLRSIYERNGGKKEEYPVQHLLTDAVEHKQSFWKSLVNQTVPIFKPPLLWRTLQLFYIMAICFSTNNAFVMWYPTIVNLYFNSFTDGWNNDKKFCTRLFGDNTTVTHSVANYADDYICDDTLSSYTIYSGIIYGLFFCAVTLAGSKFASHRKRVLIFWLIISGVSGTLVDLYHPAASLAFFVLVQTSIIGIPSAAEYCVDLYPTAYRGMMTSLSMMVARMFSLAGVNLVGAVITTHCALTFYGWAVFVFSGVIVAFYLPSDKKNKCVVTVNDCDNQIPIENRKNNT